MQPGYTDPNAMMNTWMYHPGGYASLTGQTGVTYFVAPTNQIPQFVSTTYNRLPITKYSFHPIYVISIEIRFRLGIRT